MIWNNDTRYNDDFVRIINILEEKDVFLDNSFIVVVREGHVAIDGIRSRNTTFVQRRNVLSVQSYLIVNERLTRWLSSLYPSENRVGVHDCTYSHRLESERVEFVPFLIRSRRAWLFLCSSMKQVSTPRRVLLKTY